MAISWPRPTNFAAGQPNHAPEHNLINEHLNALQQATYRTGTGIPEGVVAAPVGTRYIDTAATNGAIEWIKATGTGTTGWRVVYGDTGTRSIPGVAGAGITATTSQWRRIGGTISSSVTLRADSPFVAGGTAFTIPTGFRPAVLINSSPPYSGVGPMAIQTGGPAILWIPLATNDTRTYSWTWTTADAWPTTLPGTAA